MIEYILRRFGNLITIYHKSGARGAARLFALLAKATNAEPLLETLTQHGVKVVLTPRHYVDTEIIRRGYYEIEVLEAVLEHLRPRDVFWDVGANIGLHSVTVKSLRPDSTVVAFEPNPEMVQRLLRMMRLNAIAFQVVQSALWNTSTLQGLTLLQPFNPGMTTLLPNGDNCSPICHISCHRADDLVKQNLVPQPNVIKLDVEGAESKVLEGLTETLQSRSVRAVIFEHTPSGTTDASIPFVRLPTLGFRVERLKSHHAAPHSNYIAVRDSF